MNKKLFTLKREKERELLRVAKPVATIFLAINTLQKKISKNEKKIKGRRTKPEEIEKLKAELKEKQKELGKIEKEKITKGKNAINFLIHYNLNLVKYLAKGYSFYWKEGDHEELVSEGISSLLKAIESFDLDSKYQFSTYAGIQIRHYIQTYIKKSQFINQDTKEKKSVVYYESNYQNEDKESKSYSLLETLHDDENAELTAEQVRHQDTVIQTNNLINGLGNQEAVLLIRLLYKVKPINLLDIYYLVTEEEKKELKKKMKLNDKSNPELLQKYSCEEKKVYSLPVVKKCLALFAKDYKFSELSKVLNKSENMTRRLKQESFKKLEKMAKGRNLHFLIE